MQRGELLAPGLLQLPHDACQTPRVLFSQIAAHRWAQRGPQCIRKRERQTAAARQTLHERRDCECGCGGGWSERTAAVELDNILARVKAGVWRRRPSAEPIATRRVPTFHEYASYWLQAKTDGALRDQMGAIVRPLTLATAAGVAVSAALLPVATSAQLRLGGVDRWLPFGYAVLVAAAGFWTSYRRAGRTPDGIPFAAVAAAEAAGLVALLALFYPQIVPPSVTLYSSAASRETIDFLVIAIGVLLPLTIAYHVYANWVFRGRQPLDGAMVPHGPATARAVIRSVAPGRPAGPSRLPGAQPAEGGH